MPGLSRASARASRAVRLLLDRPDTAALLAEAWLSLAWSRLLLLFPFRRIAPMIGIPRSETEWREHPRELEQQIDRIADAVRIASRIAWWECKCLVRALAVIRMLKRRGIEYTLYLGTGRDEAGRLAAHAWLRSGSRFITGAEERNRFTVVGMYAAFGRSLDGP
jgi:hypothetical protein